LNIASTHGILPYVRYHPWPAGKANDFENKQKYIDEFTLFAI
jgi:hypothetical protein